MLVKTAFVWVFNVWRPGWLIPRVCYFMKGLVSKFSDIMACVCLKQKTLKYCGYVRANKGMKGGKRLLGTFNMNETISGDSPVDMSLWSIFISFFEIGAFTFGGGWAMVPLIQKELVDRRGWLDDSEFVDILAIAQSGPGPIAINTSVLCGNKMRGVLGAVVAALGSSLPSFLIILVIANFFLKVKESTAVQAIFKGMRPAIFGLLISAVYQVGKKSIGNARDIVFAAIGSGLLIFLDINPIFVVLLAAISGMLYGAFEHSRSTTSSNATENRL